MAYDADVVTRNFIGDFLSPISETPAYSLMGKGFVSLNENPNAKIDKTPFINNTNSTGTITGYEPVFPFDVQMRTSETATMALVSVYRNRKIGEDAEFYLVRVDLFETPASSAYPARRFRVAAEISSVEGAGLEIVRIKGNLHQVDDAVEGTFNPTTKAFTAAA